MLDKLPANQYQVSKSAWNYNMKRIVPVMILLGFLSCMDKFVPDNPIDPNNPDSPRAGPSSVPHDYNFDE